ncbi:MAG: FAD binding domain-containing protein [Ignavibacteriales bacterium]|nr:FAD binding domain-containing protein [Ignavibacteriales bacterium]
MPFNLSKLFKLFASLPIRNSATIAGNIVNASPIADITITLLALKNKD